MSSSTPDFKIYSKKSAHVNEDVEYDKQFKIYKPPVSSAYSDDTDLLKNFRIIKTPGHTTQITKENTIKASEKNLLEKFAVLNPSAFKLKTMESTDSDHWKYVIADSGSSTENIFYLTLYDEDNNIFPHLPPLLFKDLKSVWLEVDNLAVTSKLSLYVYQYKDASDAASTRRTEFSQLLQNTGKQVLYALTEPDEKYYNQEFNGRKTKFGDVAELPKTTDLITVFPYTGIEATPVTANSDSTFGASGAPIARIALSNIPSATTFKLHSVGILLKNGDVYKYKFTNN